MRNNKGYSIIQPLILTVALALFLSFCIDMTGESLRRTELFFVVVCVALVCFVFRKNLPRQAVIWVMCGGAFIKTAYIIYTATWVRQHDVISFGAGEGHAAYIEYILANKALPNFDPRLLWSFFQPPLHHIISAAWMWINIRLGIAGTQLEENVQVLTLSYMTALMLITYFICKELYMKQRGVLITMLIVAFHPMYTLLSGSINNDALSVFLSGLAVYVAILWYKNPGFIKIILLALCIGFGMMAKLSAALIAPGIGVFMLYKLFTDKKSWIKYIFQFAVFAAVVFPIGLWWTVRNMILWKMPVNYIPEVGQQLVKSDFISRVFDIRTGSVYTYLVDSGYPYDEYNVILAMIKTSLFGETDFGQISAYINPFAIILFAVSIVIIILEIVAFAVILIRRESAPGAEYKILLGVSAVTIFIGYLSFALGYNNFSAQDFRYAALLVSIMAIFLGFFDDRLDAEQKSKNISEKKRNGINILRRSILALSIVFAVSSCGVYLLVGLA